MVRPTFFLCCAAALFILSNCSPLFGSPNAPLSVRQAVDGGVGEDGSSSPQATLRPAQSAPESSTAASEADLLPDSSAEPPLATDVPSTTAVSPTDSQQPQAIAPNAALSPPAPLVPASNPFTANRTLEVGQTFSFFDLSALLNVTVIGNPAIDQQFKALVAVLTQALSQREEEIIEALPLDTKKKLVEAGEEAPKLAIRSPLNPFLFPRASVEKTAQGDFVEDFDSNGDMKDAGAIDFGASIAVGVVAEVAQGAQLTL